LERIIKGVAFDLEGTVVDVEHVHHRAHLAVAEEVGIVISLDDAISKIPHFIGGPDETIYREMCIFGGREATREIIAAMLSRKRVHYERLLERAEIQKRPGFSDVFHVCRDLCLKVSIGSLTPSAQAKILMDRSGLDGLFLTDPVVLREHVELAKPAPDVFLKTAAVMGVAPVAQLVFEDSPNGVRAAVAAGSIAVGMPVYRTSETVGRLLDAGAKRVFFDWREMNIVALIDNLENESI